MTTNGIDIFDASGNLVTDASSPTPWRVVIEPRAACGEKLSKILPEAFKEKSDSMIHGSYRDMCAIVTAYLLVDEDDQTVFIEYLPAARL